MKIFFALSTGDLALRSVPRRSWRRVGVGTGPCGAVYSLDRVLIGSPIIKRVTSESAPRAGVPSLSWSPRC